MGLQKVQHFVGHHFRPLGIQTDFMGLLGLTEAAFFFDRFRTLSHFIKTGCQVGLVRALLSDSPQKLSCIYSRQ